VFLSSGENYNVLKKKMTRTRKRAYDDVIELLRNYYPTNYRCCSCGASSQTPFIIEPSNPNGLARHLILIVSLFHLHCAITAGKC
jgi:hypothetical protein